MLAALLLLAAALDPQTAIDAERAFNAAAQAKGQWTAFRDYAAPEAVMFVPQPINAQQWLKDRADPPRSVEWWPSESFVSCDGSLAVNTGGWKRPDGSVGYFTTVWKRQADGSWKWLIDHGDTLSRPRAAPDAPATRSASCDGGQGGIISPVPRGKGASGMAADRTLFWRWEVNPNGARSLVVLLWTGTNFDTVLQDDVAAPPAQ